MPRDNSTVIVLHSSYLSACLLYQSTDKSKKGKEMKGASKHPPPDERAILDQATPTISWADESLGGASMVRLTNFHDSI